MPLDPSGPTRQVLQQWRSLQPDGAVFRVPCYIVRLSDHVHPDMILIDMILDMI